MSEPIWLNEARSYLGMAEIQGPHHNPKVVALWKRAKVGGVDDDETPWCAAFVSAILEDCGITSARSGWARDYLKFGAKLDKPQVGCIVVFERGSGGHVGFVVGKDPDGNLLVLGGNQADQVCVRAFSRDRVLGYRWPLGFAVPTAGLPVLTASVGALSRNEA